MRRGRPADTELWDHWFTELKEYKEGHGDCDVPRGHPENPALSRWVDRQRTLDKTGKLAEDRSERLEDIGFSFGKEHGARWGERFREWKRFKRRHGHGNVPQTKRSQTYTENPGLGKWVHNQRQRNKNGKLSEERKNLLEDAGFVWNARNPPVQATGDSDAGNFSGRVAEKTNAPEEESAPGESGLTTNKRRSARRMQCVKREAGVMRRSVAAKVLGGTGKRGAQNPNRRSSASSRRKGDESGHSCELDAGKLNAARTRLERASRRSQQKNKQIDACRWNAGGNIKLDHGKHGQEQQIGMKREQREDEVTDSNFKGEVREGADGIAEASRADLVGDGKKVRVLLQSSEGQERMKEEYPLILAANPIPPLGQTEPDEPDYKDLCDKLTTKVFEYKAKISSLKRENQSLKEEVYPILHDSSPSPPVRQTEPDELDGAFYKDLCERMTNWFDGHRATLASLKRENESLKDELAHKRACAKVPEECISMG